MWKCQEREDDDDQIQVSDRHVPVHGCRKMLCNQAVAQSEHHEKKNRNLDRRQLHGESSKERVRTGMLYKNIYFCQ